MKTSKIVAAALLTMLLAPWVAMHAAQQDTAIQRMHDFLLNVHSLKADFSQVVLDANLQTLKKSAGTLAIKRPDRFRWDYATPNKEIIVADGKRLWIYDVELQQVTVKRLTGTLAASPAVLLSGSNDVGKSFVVKDLGESQGLQWVMLIPKVKDTDFDSVRMGFKGQNVSVMELKDALGNLTRITFSHLIVNPSIPDSEFRFTPPAGADVIGDRVENRQ
ncbi:MAG: outer membrane lipoprotein chaperone LolA [Gammaproteobacteria bacterium]|nr:outer membrane lipoprotein chaperone LolA [Gammaproteobacteria bacterium]MDE2346008.1 outer membrane lipoprotein chaperone LolA [Gammaproteobacteria bacterium]